MLFFSTTNLLFKYQIFSQIGVLLLQGIKSVNIFLIHG
jgi:hypothetical protein